MLDAHQPFRDFIFPAVRFDGSLMYVKGQRQATL